MRLSILLVVLLAAPALAEGPILNRDCTKTTCPPSRYCCPDDYCPRPQPTVCPTPRGCVDDYCPRPFPPASKSCPGTCDDYCPKWFPVCLPPSIQPWFRCGGIDCQSRARE